MSFQEYASYDGLGLAKLVVKGEVTASELVEEAIARIEKHNPTLNAVIHKTYETARKLAGSPPVAGQEGIQRIRPIRGRRTERSTPLPEGLGALLDGRRAIASELHEQLPGLGGLGPAQ